ncbi:hypothetical protein ABTN42_22030, partial [Acinetobacter baumannii]
ACALFTLALLSGCDKIKDIDEIKSEAISSRAQLAEIKAELSTIRIKIAVLEDAQRIASLEAAQRKIASNDNAGTRSAEEIATITAAI